MQPQEPPWQKAVVSAMNWLDLIKTAGSVASAFMGVIAALTLLLKPVRKKIVEGISRAARTTETSNEVAELRDVVEKQNAELHSAIMAICEENKRQSETLNDLTEAVALSNRASRAALGNTIKHIYYKYLPSRRLPVHEIEALHMIHTTYKEEGGNSFVDAIFNEMMNEWEHTVE